MKIEPNMYVRTKYNGISKIVDYINDPTHYFFKCYKLDRDYINCEEYITETDVLKASHNIIDLIEVGDYVNGYKVYYCYCADEDSTGLFIDTEKGRQWLDKPSQVKSIVTKEQFSAMEYKLD